MGLLVSIYLSISLFAGGVEFYPPKTSVWKNTNCEKNQTCDLKGAVINVQRWVADYRDRFGDGAYNFGDTMFLSYETKNIGALENYGVVQYVKGCVYANYYKNGELQTFFPYARHVHNETPSGPTQVWLQKDWIIDSDDKDPMYNSPFPTDYADMKVPSRHGFYRWNSVENFDVNGLPISRQSETEELYGFKFPPTFPKLYIVDRPGSAFASASLIDGKPEIVAKNISLDFKVCIYKTQDIPKSVDQMGEQVFIDNPLTCFDWKSREVYNWDTKKYETPEEMSGACMASKK
ncbi:MAG: hypothetical protein KDD37_06315 [Bdellovibrionales bacterium]|nr:hypothetical protein [Bdellovibrionales bacterium]